MTQATDRRFADLRGGPQTSPEEYTLTALALCCIDCAEIHLGDSPASIFSSFHNEHISKRALDGKVPLIAGGVSNLERSPIGSGAC